jgi:hypothetical protein
MSLTAAAPAAASNNCAEDLDERGNTRPAIGSAMVEMQRGDRASLLLRVRSLDPRRCVCVRVGLAGWG